MTVGKQGLADWLAVVSTVTVVVTLSVCRDQSAFMIPAPEHFDSLIDHLENAGVEVSTLREAIISYLEENDFNISGLIGYDPTIDHQVYYYRNVLQEFLKAITEE